MSALLTTWLVMLLAGAALHAGTGNLGTAFLILSGAVAVLILLADGTRRE